ncbi:MAG: hypothetical protein AAFQ94_13465 [Bacteroidota bacterium]
MNLFKIYLMLICLFSSFVVLAQPPNPPATPIDGGLGLLLAGGAAYGIKKVRDHRKRANR